MNLVLQAQMAGCLSFKVCPLSFLLPTTPLNVCLVSKGKNRYLLSLIPDHKSTSVFAS